MDTYNPKEIEEKWQKKWEEGAFKAIDFLEKEKFYILVEFPYPSGAGLHTGHCRSYTAMDVISRKKRMEGYNVLYPMGWDAFGLPTENYAIKTGLHPSIVTKQNTDTFRNQLKKLGFSFDWEREVNTTDKNYYKWTQWIFIKLFEKGLAYKEKSFINWCPSCKIGLANEEVITGNCERCGEKVEKKEKEQWMIKITKYAERLLQDLENVDYLEKIKHQQREWIGKSEGINITYNIENLDKTISVFTTRPDTNFGATFLTIAPDSNFLKENLEIFPEKEKVEKYVKESLLKSDIDRTAEGRKKTGVFTGLYAINNLNNKKMPIYVSDFVLGHFGTGCVVGVPGHDKRDFEFAKEMGIEVIRVVVGKDNDTSNITKIEQVQEEEGVMINSDFLNGKDIHEAIKLIMDYIEEKGYGKRVVNYKLRDWVFSRQHYWGEPIPMIYCDNCSWFPVKEESLPVELPNIENYKPSDTGESPLSLIDSWVNIECPKCKGNAKRETDTMPNWAGSNWYFLRYLDVNNNEKLADTKKINYWMPVDWYNGGMEHTTLHLLYSRFIFKFLYDIGAVSKEVGSEPYKKRTSHGMVLGEGGIKMSKSKGNVVNPDEIVKEFGADTLRVYTMFMGPFDQAIAWDQKGVNGAKRFLDKIFSISISEKSSDIVKKEIEKVIAKVSNDINSLKFNTAISTLMEFSNVLKKENIGKEDYRKFLIILSPFAPHIAEELWQKNGFEDFCFNSNWPEAQILEEENINIIIQINGKLRATINVLSSLSEGEITEIALSNEKIKDLVNSKEIKKTIFVPKRLINFVI